MKTLKLNALLASKLEKQELNSLVGGTECGCGCTGSSSNFDNGTTNHSGGKWSSGLHTEQTIYLDEVVCTPQSSSGSDSLTDSTEHTT